MTSGSATMSSTVMRGLSEPNGSWKMYWMWRRNSRSSDSSSDRTSTCRSPTENMMWPVSAFSPRMISLLTVVLPEPLSPTTAKLSPRWIVNETSSTAVITTGSPPSRPERRARKVLRRPSTSSSTPPGVRPVRSSSSERSSARLPSILASRRPSSRAERSVCRRGTARSRALR